VAETEPRAAPVRGWRTTVVRTAEDQVSVWQENTEGTFILVVGLVLGAALLALAALSSIEEGMR
jgi:hypothetical protein